jgi:hypothetical protein
LWITSSNHLLRVLYPGVNPIKASSVINPSKRWANQFGLYPMTGVTDILRKESFTFFNDCFIGWNLISLTERCVGSKNETAHKQEC